MSATIREPRSKSRRVRLRCWPSAPTDTPMSEYEFTVSLRIRHPTIDPATISAALGIEPQHTWRAGQPRCDPAGAELGGTHHDSYWMGRLMDEPQLSSDGVSVERVILKTLSQLRRTILPRAAQRGGRRGRAAREPLRARRLPARAPFGLPGIARPDALGGCPGRSSSFTARGADVATELTRVPLEASRIS